MQSAPRANATAPTSAAMMASFLEVASAPMADPNEAKG